MLRKITQNEFEQWHATTELAYAKDKMQANGLTWEEALALSKKSFADLLPAGLNTPHNYLYCIEHEGEKAGQVWFALQGKDLNRAFIYDLIVEEKFRGKGLGRQLMMLAEIEARHLGAVKIGLHVFGFNQRAINLYQSLNYLTTDLVMEKKLT
jgi:ribosomal protein S18 acetylase RimI-like enzyme